MGLIDVRNACMHRMSTYIWMSADLLEMNCCVSFSVHCHGNLIDGCYLKISLHKQIVFYHLFSFSTPVFKQPILTLHVVKVKLVFILTKSLLLLWSIS